MSRIIVKNLPKGSNEEKIRDIFAAVGEVTDIQLKFTKSGVFRKFGFIGFKTKKDAEKAINHFDKSFIETSRIQVEEAKGLNAGDKERPWSKYSEGSSAYKQLHEKVTKKDAQQKQSAETDSDSKIKKKKEKKREHRKVLDELEDDPEFRDFLEVHNIQTKKHTWSNDASVGAGKKGSHQENSDGESVDSLGLNEEDEQPTDKSANKSTLSDMEYLRSKMVTDDIEEAKKHDSKKKKKKKKNDQALAAAKGDSQMGESMGILSNQTKVQQDGDKIPKRKSKKQRLKMKLNNLMVPVCSGEPVERGKFIIKVSGVPYKFKQEDIVDFFAPLKIKSIKVFLDDGGNRIGILFVEFSSQKEVQEALKRNKEYIGRRSVTLTADIAPEKGVKKVETKEPPWAKQAAELEDADSLIGETGRLFVRNLTYSCTEEDIEQLFSKYGPLVEVSLPVDTLTKKIKGFCFLTFMMPEHAVKAFTELDGSRFMGRLLHILPGKEKTEDDEDALNEGSSYKNKKKAKDKAMSTSSHNWNTLFIGSNAVAEAMADRYNTTKSAVLDPDSKGSLGVRLALGETQIVADTRQFLIDNGVALDSFSQANAPRSKSVLLAKNLPAGTDGKELRELFQDYGELGRVLLPPAGVTGIIEFLEPSEARVAFFKLAYTKFHHAPLYLEWAPVDVFGQKYEDGNEIGLKEKEKDMETADNDKEDQDLNIKTQNKEDKEGQETEDDFEEETEPESTLFVKNLNFETVEGTLKEVFSKCGEVRSVVISKKRNLKKPGEMLSMGFGFVEFKRRDGAMKALKELQHTEVDGHSLELKISNRSMQSKQVSTRKSIKNKKQTSTKIMVRNIPFEATEQEIKDLFSTFGEIKFVRLPKKLSGTGTHRGFGFVDFLTKQDAKRAFTALCHSSHLYGRRLVLEWADTDESVEQLRKRTAEHYSEGGKKKRLRHNDLLEELK